MCVCWLYLQFKEWEFVIRCLQGGCAGNDRGAAVALQSNLTTSEAGHELDVRSKQWDNISGKLQLQRS